MLNIAICDDEEYFRELIRTCVCNYMDDRDIPFKIDLFDSGKSFLALGFHILKYHIVFLDINMNGIDGIETAKLMRKVSNQIYLVFVTAYMDYTLEGYKVDAVRYLLKRRSNLQEPIDECMNAIFEKMNMTVSKIKFKFQEGEREISTVRLLYVESRLHKLEFHMMEDEEQVYTLYEKLNAIEKQLEGHSFIRVHQSYLINMKYIQSIKRYKVILNQGLEFPIPRIRYRDVFDAYMLFKGEL